jgi:hypothetical protein
MEGAIPKPSEKRCSAGTQQDFLSIGDHQRLSASSSLHFCFDARWTSPTD